MDKLLIDGGQSLAGAVKISAAKNSVLPMLCASVMSSKGSVKLENVPHLQDVTTTTRLLTQMGVSVTMDEFMNIDLDASTIHNLYAPYDLVKTMRSSILVLGPLLAKYGSAKVSLPGGCSIGSRPIDLHLNALKKMGAKINVKNGYIIASAKNGLKGSLIKFPKISVGATQNILIASCFSKGKTKLRNCASEPEVQDLINFLKKLGCKINKIGKRSIDVNGVVNLKSTMHTVVFDRIEAGTYIIAAAITNGRIKITNIDPKIISTEISLLGKMGVKIVKKKNYIIVTCPNKIKGINTETQPYPGFPTDLQAQIMVLMTKAEGISVIKENIFENRFMHVSELRRMGANIEVAGNRAKIYGGNQLYGAELMATDLRASVSLVLAGLNAKEKTVINRIYHLDRGYEKIEKKLSNCGAYIRRLKWYLKKH